jgi:hypothetical protein
MLGLALLLIMSSVLSSSRPALHRLAHAAGPGLQGCGRAWRDQYASLHGRVLAGRSPTKHVVALAVDAGLADRLTGTISVFFYALLSGRAFQVVTYPGVVGLEEAFEPASVDWRRPEVDARVIENIKCV